jgi:hypothetical protein
MSDHVVTGSLCGGIEMTMPRSNRANDTSAAAWNAQQAALARMGPESRMRIAIDLSESVREIQIEGMLARNPEWSRRDAIDWLVQYALRSRVVRP